MGIGVIAAARRRTGGPTLAIPPSYRSSRIAYTTGSTATVTLPTGAASGDLCLVGYENAWNRSFGVMSGWTGWQNLQGSNISGEIYTKILTSGDVATGSVSIPLDGSYDGIAFALCFIGATSGVRTSAGLRDSVASTPRTIATDGTPQVGDMVVLFGAVRDINMTVTLDTVSTLQATSGANASGALGIGVLTAAGVNSFTANYASGPSGDYTAALIIAP